jgi:hypothetical protein
MSRRSWASIELGRPAVPFTVPRLDGGRRPRLQLSCHQGGKLPPLEPVGTAARGLPKNVFHEKTRLWTDTS